MTDTVETVTVLIAVIVGSAVIIAAIIGINSLYSTISQDEVFIFVDKSNQYRSCQIIETSESLSIHCLEAIGNE